MPASVNPILLRGVTLAEYEGTAYPFTVPTITTLRRLELDSPVSFLAGGNGTGKSTLLEAIAIGSKRVSVSAQGYSSIHRGVHDLASALDFQWVAWHAGMDKSFTKNKNRGFFLRAEDFLEYKRGISSEVADLRRMADDFGDRFEGYGRDLARAAALGQASALTSRYGEDPDAMSHGESFLQFFRARFTGPGLYLLDEPDTALSPQSVMGLMAAIGDMVNAGAQFIVATHNPILLAYPGATIYGFDGAPVRRVAWDQLEQVQLVREFLGNPKAYLRHLNL